jgi:uncharacterized protein YabE (DUF348 family)
MERKFLLDLDPKIMESAKGRFRRWLEHPFGWPLLVFFGLVAVTLIVFGVLVWRGDTDAILRPSDNHVVIVTHDGEKQIVPTDEKTVGTLLKRLKIELKNGDRVEPDLTVPITQDKFLVNIYRAAPVYVSDGAKTAVTDSAAGTARGMAEQAGVQLYPEDTVSLAPTVNFVTQQSVAVRATVERAVPIRVALYGAPAITMRTQAKTIAEFIKEKNIVITKADTVKPGTDTTITEGMELAVIRNGIHTISVNEDIAPPEQTVTDASLSLGATAVRQAGTAGKRTNTYEINVQNGEEVSRKLLQSVVTVEPVPKIVVRGSAVYVAPDKTAVMAAAGISPSDYGAVDYIVSRESGWCPTKLQGTHVCPAAAPGYYPSGKGYGLVQATPASKMASAGSDWETNPVTQLKWATGYASRYGGWQGAYLHWLNYHWW